MIQRLSDGISDGEIGVRIDNFVAERGRMTRSASQKLIEGGAVTVSGKTVAKSYRLRAGDIVEYKPPELKPDRALPENIPLDIIYEDSSIIVVNKPKGMVVHPAAGNEHGTLVSALLYHCGEDLSKINGTIRPGIVHRIDRDTSGLLVAAKTDAAHLNLAAQLKKRTAERTYHAIVIGSLRDDSKTINLPIGRHPVHRKKMAVLQSGAPGARNAVTHYRVLERYPGYTYAEIRLETGRTHQIRVHMAKTGHPLLGDTVYGGRNKFAVKNAEQLKGQCLHAKTLGFDHPISGERVIFDAPLPKYFIDMLKKIKERDA